MSSLLFVGGAAAVVAVIAARIVFPAPSTPAYVPSSTSAEEMPAENKPWQVDPTPTTSASTPAVVATPGAAAMREYAVALPELRGLPLDAAPGTTLELWVAWDDAYAEGPQMQKLVTSVTVSRFVEPVTAEGPLVVVLSVPEKAMRAVMYGDRFGSFSVALPTEG